MIGHPTRDLVRLWKFHDWQINTEGNLDSKFCPVNERKSFVDVLETISWHTITWRTLWGYFMKLVTVNYSVEKVIHIVVEIKAKVRAIVDRLHQMQAIHKWWILTWVKNAKKM